VVERFRYDRSSKWLLEHHGDALLRLGGQGDLIDWRAVQSEVVQPRQLPDGLLDVRVAGEERRRLYVVEIATYPDRRIAEQVVADVTLVLQDRGVLPDVLVLVLQPKGNLEVDSEAVLQSAGGWTGLRVGWRTVRLWELPAGQLLATGEPGLMPWVPLAHIDGPPKTVFQQCREIIDQKGPANERENLLAVAQVLASLRYNDPSLLELFGGEEGMIESPLLQKVLAERAQRLIRGLLEDRFGPVPADVATALADVRDEGRLDQLNKAAARCPDLATFRRELAATE
jgi:hypothetical protein